MRSEGGESARRDASSGGRARGIRRGRSVQSTTRGQGSVGELPYVRKIHDTWPCTHRVGCTVPAQLSLITARITRRLASWGAAPGSLALSLPDCPRVTDSPLLANREPPAVWSCGGNMWLGAESMTVENPGPARRAARCCGAAVASLPYAAARRWRRRGRQPGGRCMRGHRRRQRQRKAAAAGGGVGRLRRHRALVAPPRR